MQDSKLRSRIREHTRGLVRVALIAVICSIASSPLIGVPIGSHAVLGGPTPQASTTDSPGASLGQAPSVRAVPPDGSLGLVTQYALDVQNGTLMPGNQPLTDQNLYEPFYVAYDPTLNRLYLSEGCDMMVLNPSTLTPEAGLAASGGCGVIYLPTTGYLYLSEDSYVVVVNPINDSVVQRIYAPQAGQTTYGLFVYDARANAILVGSALDDSVNVVNLSLGRVVATIYPGYEVDDGAYDPVNANVYLAGYENNTVIEVNSSTWSLHYLYLPSTIFGFLEGVAVDSQTGNVYATSVFYCPGCYGSDNVVELSGQNGSVLAIQGIGSFTTGMVYDSGIDRLFVADSITSRVYVLYPGNLSTAATIYTNAPGSLLYGAWWLAYVPQLNTIYAPTSYQDSVLAISDVSLSVYLSWGGFEQPYAEAWDSGCGCLVVGDWWEDRLYFVNESTYQISRTVYLGGTIRGITYDPTTNQLWVGMGDLVGASGLAVVNGTDGSLVTRLTSGAWFNAPAFDSADQRMYAPSVLASVVDIYNSTNLTYVGQVNASYASNVVWDSENDQVFVSDWESDNVSVLDGSSGSLVTTIHNVPGPNAIAYDPQTSRVYTGDENSPNITAIAPSNDSIAGNISYPPYAAGLAPSPSGDELLVTNDGPEISELNLTTNVSVSIPAGSETAGLAWMPDGVLAASDLTGGVYFLSSGGPTPLTTPALNLTPSFVVLGGTLNVSTSVSDGSGGDSYVYNGLPLGCPSVDAADFTCTPAAAGQFQVTVTVSDSAGESLNGTAYLWVAVGYLVTLSEVGLPADQPWSVHLATGQTFEASDSTITCYEPNGSYGYWLTTANPMYAAPAGLFTVEGSPTSVAVNFSLVYFVVSFSESGLPDDTDWWVNLTNGQSFSSNNSTLSFEETNGTYDYELATSDKEYMSSGAMFAVSGSPVIEPVTFSLVLYSVTFVSSGLPWDIEWWVNLTNGQSFTGEGPDVGLSEPNGTYSYNLSSANPSYRVSGGTFEINGAPTTVAATFVLWTTVTFTETGLPTNTEWWIRLPTGPSQVGFTSVLSLEEPNGTYSYSASTSDTTYEASGGSFTVSGAALEISVAFVRVTFLVAFTASSLPPGTEWWVNVTNGPSEQGTSDTISFQEPNGTYEYSIGTTDKAYEALGGRLALDGAPISISVEFYEITYTLAFTEAGLPTGSIWWVSLAGEGKEYSTLPTLTFEVSNGSYTYTTGTPVTGYNASIGSEPAIVNGSPQTVSLSFQETGGGGSGTSPPSSPASEDWTGIGAAIGVAAAVVAVGTAVAVRRRRLRKGSVPNSPESRR
jgi:hypothetical protein